MKTDVLSNVQFVRGMCDVFSTHCLGQKQMALFLDVSTVCHDPQTGVKTSVGHVQKYLDVWTIYI